MTPPASAPKFNPCGPLKISTCPMPSLKMCSIGVATWVALGSDSLRPSNRTSVRKPSSPLILSDEVAPIPPLEVEATPGVWRSISLIERLPYSAISSCVKTETEEATFEEGTGSLCATTIISSTS